MLTEFLHELRIAFSQFEFAVRMLSYAELGKIKPVDFDTKHVTRFANGTLSFPSGDFSEQDSIVRAACINVVTAFAATSLVLDQTFEVFGPKCDPTASDNITRLRTLVYMVRCAHAHRLADPRWHVSGKYLTTLVINVGGQNISLNLAALNGAGFDIDSIGGYVGWYLIRDEAQRHFAKHYE